MRKGLVALLATLLLSCSTLTPEEQREQRKLAEVRWQRHLSSLEEFDNWRVSGRIAASTADDGGSARMVWTQRGDDFVLRLSAAFGRGALQISKYHWGAQLITPSGQTLTGPSADLLLYRHLGWYIPVEQLRLWLTGRPGEASDYSIDSNGLLKSARFDGWTVEFQKYSNEVRPTKPLRMVLYRHDIKIRIAIDGWDHRSQKIKSQRILLPESATDLRPSQ